MKEIYNTIEDHKNYAVSNLGKVKNFKTGRILKQSPDKDGYLIVVLPFDGKSKTFRVHRLVALAFLEEEEGKSVVDHRDGDILNNKLSNLRFCTQQQNSMNSSKKQAKTATSKYKGVWFDKSRNKWMAYIKFNRKRIHLGRYKTEIKAAKAYDERAKELFGEFAKLNFEDEDD